MFRASCLNLRKRTAWRELLHPLPIAARQRQWLKRDLVEVNEEILRRPFYKYKSVAASGPANESKRAQLKNPLVIGPQFAEDEIPRDVRRLRPAYAESFGSVPLHRPGRQAQ
jgi:hypothetical protein